MAESIVKLRVDATGATSALKKVQNQSTQLQRSFGGLKTAIAGVGFTVLAKNTISTTANFKTLQLRMKGLTSEYGEFAQVQELVTKAQNKFNLSIVEATKSVTDIFARLRPLGIELKEIETAFMGFNTIAVAAGLNANEMNAAFTQLAQGLGSGQLQGDEFRSIAEQIPQLLSAISKETGIAEGKLKNFASKGLLKTDIIIRALANSTEKYQDTVDDIIKNSPEAAFKAFSNAALELQLTIGSKLTPVLADSAIALANLVDGITKLIDSEVGQASAIIAGLALAVKGISVVMFLAINSTLTFIVNLQALAVTLNGSAGALSATSSMALLTSGSFAKAALAANAFKVALAKTGIGLAVIAFGTLTTAIIKAINKQKEFNELLEKGSSSDIQSEIKVQTKLIDNLKDQIKKLKDNPITSGSLGFLKAELATAEKELKKLQDRLVIVQGVELFRDFEKAEKALQATNEKLKENIERSKITTEEGRKQFDLEQKKIQLTEKYGPELAKQLIENEKINQSLRNQLDQIKKNQEATKVLKEKFMEIGQSVEDGIVSSLADAVEGTKTLAQAAISVLNDLKRKLIEVAIQQAVSGINGKIGGFLGKAFVGSNAAFGGGKAAGGPVAANKSFVVGEKGPEILSMGSSRGFITPNHAIGGSTNVVVNVDASGTSVQGDEDNSAELGRLVGAAVQAEMIRQQRPGGILAR